MIRAPLLHVAFYLLSIFFVILWHAVIYRERRSLMQISGKVGFSIDFVDQEKCKDFSSAASASGSAQRSGSDTPAASASGSAQRSGSDTPASASGSAQRSGSDTPAASAER